jgi:uncharacterized paraquat-inducible protein A
MATVTGSSSRTSQTTHPKKCTGCGRAFWTPRLPNGTSVRCPHCSRIH